MIPAEIHPAPGAGRGVLEPRRTTYKPGDRVIELRRCAQCGFFNRVGIEVEGDSQDSPGINLATATITNARGTTNLPRHLQSLQPAPASGKGFDFSTTNLSYSFPNQVSGCRFCGSLNSSGKYRNWKDFGTGVDLSNR